MDFLIIFVGFATWIVLAVWIVSLIHWMITADIDVAIGVPGVWVGIGLGYIAFKPPQPWMSPLSFVATLVTVVMYPYVRSALHAREWRSIDIEALERAYEALAQKPQNPVAKFKVAQEAYALGMPGHALAIAEGALAYLPETHFVEEHRVLKRWKATVNKPDQFRAIPCVECHFMNAPGTIHCQNCGAPFLLDRAKGKVLAKGEAKKLIAVWFTLVACLAGIPASTALPAVGTIVVIVTLLLASAAVVLLAFRGGGQAT